LTVAAFAVAIYVKKRNDRKAKATQGYGSSSAPTIDDDNEEDGDMMYLMLVGILGASVTYLTGLKPPGGTWRDDGDGHSAGNPVLYDTGKRRYNAFFYSNSTSFMISVNIIAWLLVRMIWGPRRNGQQATSTMTLSPLYKAMVLDLLALLGAYAAGSARKWGTTTKVVVMLVPVVLVVWLLLFFCEKQTKDNQQKQDNQKK
jgi:heme/copper-type cytochrome/quinol oxidase subunit 2